MSGTDKSDEPGATLIGLDVGASLTKTVAVRGTALLGAVTTAGEDVAGTAVEGVRRLLSTGAASVEDAVAVALTGARAGSLPESVAGLRVQRIDEFRAIGRGGLHLTGLAAALVASMGTGTAFVSARVDSFIHFGGTALGGGTLCGLGVRLLGTDDVAAIVGLAASGDLHRVDLYVGDISREAIGDLGREITAANLGRLGMSTSPADLALGLLNLVVQNVALMAAAAARLAGVDTVVLNGTLATVPQAPGMAGLVAELTGIRFVVPEGAAYATAIGAALSAAGG